VAMSVTVLPLERRLIVALKDAEHGLKLTLWKAYLKVIVWIGEERGMGEKDGMYARRRRNEEQSIRAGSCGRRR